MKKQGHYCKICGEYKANEKFSGTGHAAHICKSCASMSVEDRNQEMTLTRIMNLPWRLSKEQCAWLKKHCKVERQHRTDELRFYKHMRMFGLEDGRKQLAVYQRKSNNHIMTCLGMRSPNQALELYRGVMW